MTKIEFNRQCFWSILDRRLYSEICQCIFLFFRCTIIMYIIVHYMTSHVCCGRMNLTTSRQFDHFKWWLREHFCNITLNFCFFFNFNNGFNMFLWIDHEHMSSWWSIFGCLQSTVAMINFWHVANVCFSKSIEGQVSFCWFLYLCHTIINNIC